MINKLLLTILLSLAISMSGCMPNNVSTVVPAKTQPQQQSTEQVTSSNTEALKVIYLDVGQGASQLLISPSGKTMLIDAGNNDKEQLMLDYMKKYNINKLDIVIGTHPDSDHIGGLDKVIDNLKIGKVYLPKEQSTTKNV